MPNLLAHSLIVKRLNNSSYSLNNGQNSFLKGNYDFLVLGSLGPDPLFYMGILPFSGLHLITACKKIGNKIHKMDGKTFFKLLINQVYFIENDLDQTRFKAFVFGQFAHYILDREAHPFIMYESGFDDNGNITSHYHFDHAFFETNIDCALAKKYAINRFFIHPEETIPSTTTYLRIIDFYLVPVLKELFGEKHLPKHMYSNAINNMRRLLKTMNHNGKIKSKILGKNIALSAMYFPKEIDFSTLNEEKEIWLDPVSGKESNESFLEIHTRSFRIVEQCYKDILKNGFNYSVFAKYLDGRDYYGFVPGEKKIYKKENNNRNIK